MRAAEPRPRAQGGKRASVGKRRLHRESPLGEPRIVGHVSPMLAAPPKPAMQSLDLAEIEAALAARGQPKYRAAQVLRWLYEKRAKSFAEMSDLPAALRADLAETFTFLRLEKLRVLGSRGHHAQVSLPPRATAR